VGLAWVLWNQDLSSGWGQLEGKKIEYMRGDKEFRGRVRENGTNEQVTQGDNLPKERRP
jgi:hypothetical protein